MCHPMLHACLHLQEHYLLILEYKGTPFFWRIGWTFRQNNNTTSYKKERKKKITPNRTIPARVAEIYIFLVVFYQSSLSSTFVAWVSGFISTFFNHVRKMVHSWVINTLSCFANLLCDLIPSMALSQQTCFTFLLKKPWTLLLPLVSSLFNLS